MAKTEIEVDVFFCTASNPCPPGEVPEAAPQVWVHEEIEEVSTYREGRVVMVVERCRHCRIIIDTHEVH